MAFTFAKVIHNIDIGNTLFDEMGAKIVNEIKAKEKGVEVVLLTDFVCSTTFGEDGEIRPATVETGVPNGFMALDIGPESIAANAAAIAKSKTIVWNGPMGVFEFKSFEQ